MTTNIFLHLFIFHFVHIRNFLKTKAAKRKGLAYTSKVNHKTTRSCPLQLPRKAQKQQQNWKRQQIIVSIFFSFLFFFSFFFSNYIINTFLYLRSHIIAKVRRECLAFRYLSVLWKVKAKFQFQWVRLSKYWNKWMVLLLLLLLHLLAQILLSFYTSF